MPDNPLQEWHNRDRELASQEALRLGATRDELTNRYRLGLATFNAASIVAMLTALGAAPDVLNSLGFDASSIKASLILFTLGVIAAGVSISSTQNHLVERAGYASARVSVIDRLIMSSGNARGDDGGYGKAQKESLELLKKGLADRAIARWAQHLSSGSWLGGVSLPMLQLLGV